MLHSRVTVNHAGARLLPAAPALSLLPRLDSVPRGPAEATSTSAHSRRSTNTVKATLAEELRPPLRALCRLFRRRLQRPPPTAPGHPFRAQSAASSSQDRTKSPLATAAGQASSGHADWPSSGRRRCRHFRHPEAAEEAEGRPSWVREAPGYRERRRPAGGG